MPKVKMWMEIKGSMRIEETIEVPEHCLDEQGELVSEDVIEYIEEWVQDRIKWGYEPLSPPGEPIPEESP